MSFFNRDKVKDVASKALDTVEVVGDVISTKGEVVSNVADSAGTVFSGFSAVNGGINTVRSAIETGTELKKVGSALLDKKDLKDVKKDIQIRDLLAEREHCSAVLQIHNNLALESAGKVAKNLELRMNLEDGIENPARNFSAVEKTEAGRQIEKIDAENAKLLQGIANLKAGSAGVDARITEINQMPQIAQLRLLEAKVDLAKEVLKDKTTTLRSALATGEKAAGFAADGAQLVLGVVQAAAPVTQTVAVGLELAGPAIGIGVGVLNAGVSTANLVMDVREAFKLSKMANNAQDARSIASHQGNDQLEAAFKRVQLQAEHMKCVKKVEAVRDVTGIVAGSAAAVAGSAMLATAIAGAASAPGFGAGAVAPAVVTAVATTVTVSSAAVCIGAEVGVRATKAGIEHRNERIANESKLAISGLDKLVALAKDPDKQLEGKLPLTMEEQKAIAKLQNRAILKDRLDPDEAGDLAKLRNYAECRLISRENKQALEIIGKELMWECKDALLHRKGTTMVQADLPSGGPAVEGLRKLGVSDREIVGLANATAHLDTREIATKNLAAKTGLKS